MGYIGRYKAPSIVDLESPVSVDGTTIIENGVLKNVGIDGIKLKSSGDSITKSDGTTAVLSESGGVVTLNNGTIGSGVVFPAGMVLQIARAFYNGDSSMTGTTNKYAEMTSTSLTAKKDSPSYFVLYTFTVKNEYLYMNTGIRIRAEVNSSSVITGGNNYSSNAGNYQTPQWNRPENSTGDYRDQSGNAYITTNANFGDSISIYLDLFHNSGASTTSTWYYPSMVIFEV